MGGHTENLGIIEYLCQDLEFEAEDGLARDIAEGKIWPNDIYNVTYDQASKENEGWFSKAYYVFAQRDTRFVVIPYSVGSGGDKKTIFVAYEYGVGRALAKEKQLMKIKPKDLAENFVTEDITPLAPSSKVTRCGWSFGFTPSRFTVQGYQTVDIAEAESPTKTQDEKDQHKKVMFSELFFVYKPTSMHLYQSRFQDMMHKARLAYAYSLAEKNALERLKTGAADVRTNAIAMLGTYVDAVYTAVADNAQKKLDGKTIDEDDENVFNVGRAKSLCNLIARLDPGHHDKEPNEQSKKYIEALMVEKPTFNEDMKEYIKNLASESPKLMKVVGTFNWISSEIAPDPWILNTIVYGASNITEVLDGVPFAGKLFKFGTTQAAKLFGHFLRPMASEEGWADGAAKLMSVDLQMKGRDWNHENEASSDKNPATVVARRRRRTTNRRNRNDTEGQVWT